MSSEAEQSRHPFPINKPVAIIVALVLLGIFVWPFVAMGFGGVRIALESLIGGPTSADLDLLPQRWRSDPNVRAYLIDRESFLEFNFAAMAKGAKHAKPGEGECFAAIGAIRGFPNDARAAAVVADWFADSPSSIADETIAWIKRHRDNGWRTLSLPVDDRRRVFWSQLAIGAFEHKPDAQLALLASGLKSGTPATEAEWQAAAEQSPK